MENNLNEQVLDKLTKVCLCKAIPRSKMKEAIANGAKTVEDVQKLLEQVQEAVVEEDVHQRFKIFLDTYAK